MGILTKIAEGQYVVKSENINVFPCAYRGVDIDKYSILNTEYNLTHIPSTGLKASYFIKDIPAVYENKFSIDLCVGGYRFYISNLDEADYGILKTIKYYNIRTGSGSVTAEAVLADITSGNTELDKSDGNFYGLLLTVNTYEGATAYLDVADKSLIKYSQVESGTPGKSLADIVTIDNNGVKVNDEIKFIGDLTGTADKAKADEDGNNIIATYETKENVSALNTKVEGMAINLNSQEIKLATNTPSIYAPTKGPDEETAEEADMFAVICKQGGNTPGWGNLNELSVKHATTADSATNATTATNCTGNAASANKVTTYIADQKITDIFENNSATVKKATYATTAGSATKVSKNIAFYNYNTNNVSKFAEYNGSSQVNLLTNSIILNSKTKFPSGLNEGEDLHTCGGLGLKTGHTYLFIGSTVEGVTGNSQMIFHYYPDDGKTNYKIDSTIARAQGLPFTGIQNLEIEYVQSADGRFQTIRGQKYDFDKKEGSYIDCYITKIIDLGLIKI